ncbi:MAG: hypothetical protein DSY91_02485 [Deltaproteobacteria bacterium]|nr:MAG: hypothetical protein DSY91_02485 [Deltaproteobacteria bacterium]
MHKFDSFLDFMKKLLHHLDEILHILIAFLLVALVFCMAFYTITHFKAFSPEAALPIIDDIMLMLIILELLWPVLRFLRRERFSLSPFIYVGIISGVRRILAIEAKASISHQQSTYSLIEIGVSVGVVLVLGIVLLIYEKARQYQADEDD